MHRNNHKTADYDAVLDEKFGKEGTPERIRAERAACEFFFGKGSEEPEEDSGKI